MFVCCLIWFYVCCQCMFLVVDVFCGDVCEGKILKSAQGFRVIEMSNCPKVLIEVVFRKSRTLKSCGKNKSSKRPSWLKMSPLPFQPQSALYGNCFGTVGVMLR